MSVWFWARLRQMFIMDSADSVCCKRDMCLLFSLVLGSLDNTSALTFLVLGMCWMHTHSKAD